MAAGAQSEWDEDGDGIADYLKIDIREVPGTESLAHPGQTGVQFLRLKVSEDVVTDINSSGDDFSDL